MISDILNIKCPMSLTPKEAVQRFDPILTRNYRTGGTGDAYELTALENELIASLGGRPRRIK